nr:hypothetical protein [Candidatus Electrothrix aestuarii]
MKFFNTAGPVNLEDHYALPPLSRLDEDELSSSYQTKEILFITDSVNESLAVFLKLSSDIALGKPLRLHRMTLCCGC